jgi:hypothetical protein
MEEQEHMDVAVAEEEQDVQRLAKVEKVEMV